MSRLVRVVHARGGSARDVPLSLPKPRPRRLRPLDRRREVPCRRWPHFWRVSQRGTAGVDIEAWLHAGI